MIINNQPSSNPIVLKNQGNVKQEKGLDLDLLKPLMSDGVSLSTQQDTAVPEKSWHFQLMTPDVMKAAGLKGGDTKSVTILHTNDEHDPHFDKFPQEVALMKSREGVHGDANTLNVNTGDNTYESFNDKPGPQFFGPVPEFFKAMNLEYWTPGNHEFQHGGKYLQDEIIPQIPCPTLLGNVTFKSGGKSIDGTKPFEIADVNGVKVGIIGLTTPKHKTKAHPNVGFDVNVESVASAAAKYVPQAKKAGAELIVIISHEGVNRCTDAASSVPGIDVIIAGHDHETVQSPKEIKNPDGRTTLVVEAGSHGKYVGDLTMQVSPATKEVVSVDYNLYSTSSVKPDAEALAILDKYNKNSR